MPFGDANCAVLDGTLLTVIQFDAVTQIDAATGEVLRYREIDCFGGSVGLYRVEGGYIVHGETEIIMLDDGLERQWDFSGADIFATLSGKKAFELCERTIRLHDFEDNFYEIDYAGKLIAEVKNAGK